MSIDITLQAFFSGLTSGSIYAMVAIGLTIVFRVTNTLNLMQGEFVTLGALLAASGLRLGLPLPLAVLSSLGGAVAVGLISKKVVFDIVSETNMLVRLIFSLAGALVLEGVFMLIWGKSSYTLPGLPGPNIIVAGATLHSQVLWIIGIALLFLILLNLFFSQTTFGRSVRACADDEIAARLVGIPIGQTVLICTLLSTLIGVVAGCLIAPLLLINFATGLTLTIKGFVAAMLGGMRSLNGAFLGGLVLGVLEALSSGFISAQYTGALVFGMLAAALIYLPSIIGTSVFRAVHK
jgi:branched-chain amino acid transport system permease protein